MMVKQKRSWMIFACAVFASALLYPKDITPEDTRGLKNNPLRISSKKNSPAYTAFVFADWIFSETSSEFETEVVSESTTLQAGKSFDLALVNIESEVTPSLRLPEVALNAEPQKLKGMVISSASMPAEVDWVKELKTQLPQEQSRRVAQVEDWLRGQSWAAPTNAQQWKQIIKDRAPTDSQETIIASANGGQIYVGHPDRALNTISQASDQEPLTPYISEPESQMRPLTLTGSIEMKAGLAFLGAQTSLVVTRSLGGEEIESGTVWVSEGRFEIYVKEPKGYLVAELRDRDGIVLGRGSLDLYRLPPPAEHQAKVEGLALSLTPVTQGTSVATLSAHSLGGYEIPLDTAVVKSSVHDLTLKKADHIHHTEEFEEGSTLLFSASSEGSLSSLEVSQMDSEEKIFIFEESYMKALVGLLAPSDVGLIPEKGFIVGRVSDRGRPIESAEVEIAGDFSVEIVYFNEAFLPDRKLTKTTSNGLFAAILLEPSLYSVRAKTEGVYLPAQVLPVEAGKVTQSLIERKELKSLAVNLFPYPKEYSQQQGALVNLLGTEVDHKLPLGSHILQYHEGRGVFVLEATTGDFEPLLRLELPHGTDRAEIPMINQNWLNSVATKRRVNLTPATGRAFGFGPDESFEVVVDRGEGDEEIVYVDSEGQALYQDHGQPQGAFVIYNLKPGLHTISILTKNGSKIFSRIIVSEYEVVNVINP